MKKEGIILTDNCHRIWSRALGAYRVASVLRKNQFDFPVIDMITEFTPDEIIKLLDQHLDENSFFLGISATFINFIDFFRGTPLFFRKADKKILGFIVQHCREKYPNLKIIIGGPCAHNFNYLNADHYLLGYSDNQIVDFVTALKNKIQRPQNITWNDKEFDFNELQTTFLNKQVMFQGETLPIEITRGCKFKCSYCSFPLNGRSQGIYIKSKNCLLNELIYNYENFGVTNYTFVDDTFNESVDKLNYIYDVIRLLPFKISFACYLRIDLLYAFPETISLLLKMGLRYAYFGIESLNAKAARSIGKGLPPEKTMETLNKLSELWQDKVFISTSFIVGLPHDNRETVRPWMDLIISDKFKAHNIVMNSLYIAHPDLSLGFRSQLDDSFKNFGYVVTRRESSAATGSTFWENEHWDLDQCNQLIGEFWQDYLRQKPATMTSFAASSLQGYGYPFEKLMTHDLKDQDQCLQIGNLILKRIKEYKNSVLKNSNNEILLKTHEI